MEIHHDIHTPISVNDFLAVLNESKVCVFGDKAKPFSLKQINYHRYSSLNQHRYVSFKIPKKRKGEFRTISSPCKGLKCIQKCLCFLLSSLYVPNESATGFVQHKSIVDNAKKHIGKAFVYNIDLRDFFPSISSGRIWKRLQSLPFNFPPDVASLIADLCCHQGVLPQGSPTSPIMTNIVCDRLDIKLSRLAKKYKVRYTRYADDITFSSQSNVFHEDGIFLQLVYSTIQKEGFEINTDKTRLRSMYDCQEVTGVKVNSKLNLPVKYVKTIRTMLKNWERGGLDYAQSVFIKNYVPKKLRLIKCEHHIENVLAGKIEYLGMVKGKNDSTYLKLVSRLNALTGVSEMSETSDTDDSTKMLMNSLIKNLSEAIESNDEK